MDKGSNKGDGDGCSMAYKVVKTKTDAIQLARIVNNNWRKRLVEWRPQDAQRPEKT